MPGLGCWFIEIEVTRGREYRPRPGLLPPGVLPVHNLTAFERLFTLTIVNSAYTCVCKHVNKITTLERYWILV